MPEKQATITVVLADDHGMVRRGLAEFLSTASDVEIVGMAEGGRKAVSLVAEHAPDVLLLDLLMPDLPAVETIRASKRASPRTQIVMLTSHEGDDQVVPTTRAGAISYLLKDTSPRDLIIAVRRAARGEATVSPRVARALIGLVAQWKEEPALHDDLTDREREVLDSIAQGNSNQSIAASLNISEKTVKSHVSNILGKLYLTDRTQAAVYAWREGLIRKAGEPAGQTTSG